MTTFRTVTALVLLLLAASSARAEYTFENIGNLVDEADRDGQEKRALHHLVPKLRRDVTAGSIARGLFTWARGMRKLAAKINNSQLSSMKELIQDGMPVRINVLGYVRSGEKNISFFVVPRGHVRTSSPKHPREVMIVAHVDAKEDASVPAIPRGTPKDVEAAGFIPVPNYLKAMQLIQKHTSQPCIDNNAEGAYKINSPEVAERQIGKIHLVAGFTHKLGETATQKRSENAAELEEMKTALTTQWRRLERVMGIEGTKKRIDRHTRDLPGFRRRRSRPNGT